MRNTDGYKIVNEALLQEGWFASSVTVGFGRDENALASWLKRMFRTRENLQECDIAIKGNDLVIAGIGYVTSTGINTAGDVTVYTTPKDMLIKIPKRAFTNKVIVKDAPKKYRVILSFKPMKIRTAEGRLVEVGAMYVHNSGGWLTSTPDAQKQVAILKTLVSKLGL